MLHNYRGVEDSIGYSKAVGLIREFFIKKGFIEVNTQDRLSILAACEDPTTVATYEYTGQLWPLPQTGQMWLEYELLTQPAVPGVFCVSTSYRAEKNPVPGRHQLIFPMFEFESRGTIDDLQKLEAELLEHLGFGARDSFPRKNYDELAKKYGTTDLSYKEELKMQHDFGNALFLEQFPIYTSPFWNMKKNGDHANKIDVILAGNETIGSAERSTDVEEMRKQFHTISEGKYAGKLYELFGKERVEKELEEFLTLPMVPRYGGGMGMTRMINALYAIGTLKK
jgi:aspartyl/asparaginyl-tRNA synthetase